jgi:transposase
MLYCLPDETTRVAHAAFPKSNPYLRMRDVLGPISLTPECAARFPPTAQPAHAPAQRALVTIRHFAQGVSDCHAADAVRRRMDWTDVLALDITDAGCDSSVLRAFRTRLVAGQAEQVLLETMLTLARNQGFLKARGLSGRTPRLCLLPSTSSIAWNVVAKRSATRSIRWLPSRPPGCATGFPQRGSTAMAGASRHIGCHLARLNAPRAAQMGTDGRLLLPQVFCPDGSRVGA